MTYYKSKRPVDGKPPIWVIVDATGKIVNNNPSKEELKGLEKEPRKPFDTKKYKKYTDEELLYYPIQFYEEYGRVPTTMDFKNNPGYPDFSTYHKRFGSWIRSLKLAGLDIDLMGKQGGTYRGRLAEIKVIDHFRQHPIDLSGENHNSPCDGICPNGKTYDVKSSKLYDGTHYHFNTRNKYKEEIEIYYFIAFNEDWAKLEYVWRVPGEIVEKDQFYIGLNRNYEFNIENMEKYNIIDKFKDFINESK